MKMEIQKTNVWHNILVLVLVFSMFFSALSGSQAIALHSRLATLERENHFAGKEFYKSRRCQTILNGYLQLFKLYVQLQKPQLQKGAVKDIYIEDRPFLRSPSGKVLTYQQAADLTKENAFDYQEYIRYYLEHFEEFVEKGISLEHLTASLQSLQDVMLYYKGEAYFATEEESRKDREKSQKAVKKLSEEQFYQAGEIVLPEYEKDVKETKYMEIPLLKTTAKIPYSAVSAYDRWLYEQNPEYQRYRMWQEISSSSSEQKQASTQYESFLRKDYAKASLLGTLDELQKKDYKYLYYFQDDPDNTMYYHKTVWVNGKHCVTVGKLWEAADHGKNRMKDIDGDFFELSYFDDKIYKASLEEYSSSYQEYLDTLKKKTADQQETDGANGEIPISLCAVPCTRDTIANLAAFTIVFYKALDTFFSKSEFFYEVKAGGQMLQTIHQDAETRDRQKEICQAVFAGAGGRNAQILRESLEYVYYDLADSRYVVHMYQPEHLGENGLKAYVRELGEGLEDFQCTLGVDRTDFDKKNGTLTVFRRAYQQYKKEYERYKFGIRRLKGYMGRLLAGVLAMLFAGLMLMLVTGHKRGSDGIVLARGDKLWAEVVLLAILALAGLSLGIGYIHLYEGSLAGINAYGYGPVEAEAFLADVLSNAYVEAGIYTILGFFMCLCFFSLVRRIKAGCLLQTSILASLFGKVFRKSKTLWKRARDGKIGSRSRNGIRSLGRQVKKGVLAYQGLSARRRYFVFALLWTILWFWLGLLWFMACRDLRADGLFFIGTISGLLLYAGCGLLFLHSMRNAIADQEIIGGAKRIAEGDLAYQILVSAKADKEQRELAGAINRIGEGLEKAVEESVRNERMKAELITNVSHDIKTPLTSVINYVDLLKREVPEQPKAQEYLAVLEQKSQHLKNLIEDLVEASKASSGALELQITNLNLKELVSQTNGEFEERFTRGGLVPVYEAPEEVMTIRGDGRRVYRILENLYSNVVKYGMPGTRVYISLERQQGQEDEAPMLCFTMKNISREPLNISPEELMERFVRGDQSRTTEGSGLGLSIARSLTELMDGTFMIYLDGDLFRVSVCFPESRQAGILPQD